MALAPGFRADFRESLYRMIGALTGAAITILSTVEVEDSFTSLQFSKMHDAGDEAVQTAMTSPPAALTKEEVRML